jgi:hypothetical protein
VYISAFLPPLPFSSFFSLSSALHPPRTQLYGRSQNRRVPTLEVFAGRASRIRRAHAPVTFPLHVRSSLRIFYQRFPISRCQILLLCGSVRSASLFLNFAHTPILLVSCLSQRVQPSSEVAVHCFHYYSLSTSPLRMSPLCLCKASLLQHGYRVRHAWWLSLQAHASFVAQTPLSLHLVPRNSGVLILHFTVQQALRPTVMLGWYVTHSVRRAIIFFLDCSHQVPPSSPPLPPNGADLTAGSGVCTCPSSFCGPLWRVRRFDYISNQ